MAQNIKNPTHRKAITTALRSIGDPPPNSAIFASPNHPPVVIQFNFPFSQYFCGNRFYLDPLSQKSSTAYVIMVSRLKSTIAKVENSRIEVLYRITNSRVPSKHNQGGQSQARIARGIEILVDQHIKKTAEKANEIVPIKATVIVCVNLSTNGIFDHLLHKKILIGPLPEYQSKSGIHSTIKAMGDKLEDLEYSKELRLIEEFYILLETSPGKISYGQNTLKVKELVRDYVDPKGNYPEAVAFRNIFQNAAILHYNVNEF